MNLIYVVFIDRFWYYFEKKQDEQEVKEIQEDTKEIIKEKDDKEIEF